MTISKITDIPGRYVGIHLLRTVSAVNLNADFSGRPKAMRYGDANRMRVSSQSTKRAMRTYITTRLNKEDTATRTRHLPEIVAALLPASSPEGRYFAAALLSGARCTIDSANPERTKEHLFVPRTAAPALAKLVLEHKDALLASAESLRDAAVKTTEAAQAGRKAPSVKFTSPTLPKATQRAVWDALSPGANIEIALAGRMLTALPDDERYLNGAMSVAHAYTVDAYEPIMDDWTATDDWGDAGFSTAHIAKNSEARVLGSGTLYQWAMLDREQLRRNLADAFTNDEDLTAAATMAEALFIEALIEAPSKAQANSTAAHALPECVVIAVADVPLPAMPCFRQAVTDSDAATEAAKLMADYLQRTSENSGRAVGCSLNGGVVYWTPALNVPAPDFPAMLTVE